MDKCPKCGMYTIAYDGFRGVTRCLVDGCSCHIINDKSYSILRHDFSRKVVERIVVENGKETNKVLRTYSLEI